MSLSNYSVHPEAPARPPAALRLAWLVRHLWPQTLGGVETRVEAVSRHMRLRGCAVELWTCALPAGTCRLLGDGRRIRGIGGPTAPGALWRAAPLWRAIHSAHRLPPQGLADVVLSPESSLASAFILTRPEPLLYCPGGVVAECRPWLFPEAPRDGMLAALRQVSWPVHLHMLAERLCLGRAAGIVAISSIVRDQMVRTCPPCAPRVRRISNGYDPADLEQAPDDDGRPFTAICVARLHGIKNLPHLIRAWTAVRHRPRRLWLVGDGDRRESLESLVRQLGAADSVQFLGERRDVPALLGRSDVFILPSLYEACGSAVIEAMGAALPCLTLRSVPGVSQVGASDDINVDGLTGYCVDPADPAELAGRIDDLARDASARRRMGQAARARVRAEFTWSRAADAYLAFARDVRAAHTRLSGGRCPRGAACG